MMHSMRTRLFALVAVVGMLSACGDDGSSVSPRDAVLDAMTAVYEVETLHQELDISISAAGQSFSFTGEADVDNRRRRIDMTMDLGMLGGEMRMVMAEGILYVRSPLFQDSATDWVSMDPSKMDPATAAQFGGLGAGTADPSSYAGLFAGVFDVEVEGEEEVHGVPTTHYAGTIDLGKVLEGFSEAMGEDLDEVAREQLEQQVRQFEALGLDDTMPFDIWIDEEGLPRRQRLSMDFGDLVPGAEDASMDITVDFSAFGEPVDIDVPPPSEVTDMTRALREAGGSG